MKKFVVLGAALMLSGTASGELLFDPTEKVATGKLEAGALFGSSTTKYKANAAFDHDRTYMGAYGAYGIGEGLDVTAAFSVVTKAQPEGATSSGDGSQYGLGLRGKIPMDAPVDLIGYTQFRNISEKVSSVTSSGSEWSAGMFAMANAGPDITFFGGPEVILMESLAAQGTDISHDSKFGFRAGARSNISGFNVVGQLAIAHESGFQLGINKGF